MNEWRGGRGSYQGGMDNRFDRDERSYGERGRGESDYGRGYETQGDRDRFGGAHFGGSGREDDRGRRYVRDFDEPWRQSSFTGYGGHSGGGGMGSEYDYPSRSASYGGGGYTGGGFGGGGYGGSMGRGGGWGQGASGGSYGSGSSYGQSSNYGVGSGPYGSSYSSRYGMTGDWEREGDHDRGMWQRMRDNVREGWESMKESFVGKGPKGYKRSDDRIREDVCDRLMRHPMVDATEIDVQVKDGEVTLTGTVADRRMKRMAEDVVDDIHGVHEVHNQVRVRRMDSATTNTYGQHGTAATTRENGVTGTSTMGATRTGQNAVR